MSWTVGELARPAGVTARTLHHDQVAPGRAQYVSTAAQADAARQGA